MPGTSSPVRRALMKLVLSVREVADLGPATSAAIVANSVRMAAAKRRDERAAGRPGPTRGPGRLVSVDPLDASDPAFHALGGGTGVVGARCRFTESELEVVFLADDVVRVSWGAGEPPLPWALAQPGQALDPVNVTVGGEGPDGGGVTLASGALAVEVAADGSVRVVDRAGNLVRHSLPPLRRGPARTARSLLRPGERVCGLGEQASPLDLRGTTHRLWNRDPGGAYGPGEDPLYCGIPVLVGLHPEGDVLSFFENPYDATVRIDAAEGRPGTTPMAELTFSGGMLREYVVGGPLPRLLERYSALTGRPPMPPRWALGFHQCKWGYKDEADVREVVEGFAAEGVPLSAVHLDIDYMDGYRVFTVDPLSFPDLGSLVDEVAGRGTRVVTIVDPAVKVDPSYDVFSEGRRDGRFLVGDDGEPLIGVVWPGPAAFPDFTDPATRRWWSGWYRRLLDAGVAGVWHDMNEPTSITLWGDRTVPVGTRHCAEGRGGDHRECHNPYGQLMNAAGFEAMAAHAPERRPFLLSRAGWAGVQRHAWNWTADVESSWAGLRQQVATAVGLGLSGVAYTGSDIGGFSGVPTPELFVRWLELSVLMPFCRSHCVLGSPSREPWRFPEPYRGAIDRLICLRYRLVPYLYTLARRAADTGHPLVRPLDWPAPPPAAGAPRAAAGSSVDPGLFGVDDAYLLGDALLVAPALSPGSRRRAVPLPAGRWFRWRPVPAMAAGGPDGAPRDPAAPDPVTEVVGGRSVTVDTPAGQPVLFVRAGTVLVLDDGWVDPGGPDPGLLTAGHGPRLLSLHCFADQGGSAWGEGYDDAGDGDGPSRLDRFELAERTLRWEQSGGFAPPERVRVVLYGLEGTEATADGAAVPVTVHRGAGDALPATMFEGPPFSALRVDRAAPR